MPPSDCRPRRRARGVLATAAPSVRPAAQRREWPPRRPRLHVYIKKLLNHCCFTAPKQLEFWHDPTARREGRAAGRRPPEVETRSRASTGALTEEVIPMNALRAEHVEGSQSSGDRITVTLIPKATQGLRLLQDRTSLSKTDLTNRAITLYEFVDDQLRSGHDIIARNQATGETRLVKLVAAPEGQPVAARPPPT